MQVVGKGTAAASNHFCRACDQSLRCTIFVLHDNVDASSGRLLRAWSEDFRDQPVFVVTPTRVD